MDAIGFIINYEKYLNEIERVIKPELQPILYDFKEIEPHDMITPETYFINETHARGFLWTMFLRNMRSI